MPLVKFEPTISAGECPQTYALDRAATGIYIYIYIYDYCDKILGKLSENTLSFELEPAVVFTHVFSIKYNRSL